MSYFPIQHNLNLFNKVCCLLEKAVLVIFLPMVSLVACSSQIQPPDVTIYINADSTGQTISLPPGSTVQQALARSNIILSPTDRVYPPAYTTLTDGMSITVTRVSEEFETKQVVVPFERQELRNESLTSGETRLIQAGENGLNEITVRLVFENGVETGNSVVSETVLQKAVPEIVMIGVQSPFAPLTIPGILVYRTSDGNAWVMDGSTSNRRPLITSGDLDGRVFSLSPDGIWLLFSRKSALPADQEINSLWAINTTSQSAKAVNLGISNIVHFADWQPGKKYKIAYSTVEPQAASPGWDANNDLHILDFVNGKPGEITDVLDTNYGGVYPWWGMSFAWSPDGNKLAYSRPDGVGLVDLETGKLTPLIKMTALNTHGDWAWTPGITWSSDDLTLYAVTHSAPTGLIAPEDSPNFDLIAISLPAGSGTTLVSQTGMFAYPIVSPLYQNISDNPDYQIAYLQAVFPGASSTSRYKVMITNNNGSNSLTLFPAEGQPALEPQSQALAWAPRLLDTGTSFIGVIYEGNLWIVDSRTGKSQQVTGDGLTTNIDWK